MLTRKQQAAALTVILAQPPLWEAWALSGPGRIAITTLTRLRFKTDTPQGRALFTFTWGTFAVWFWRHVLKRPKHTLTGHHSQ